MSEPTLGARKDQGPSVGAQVVAKGVEKGVATAVSTFASPVVGKVAGVAAGKIARTKTGQRLLVGIVVALLVASFVPLILVASAVFMVAGSMSALMGGGGAAVAEQSACYGSAITVVGAPANLAAEQTANLTTILQTVAERGLGAGDAVITVMTALTESGLVNLDHGDAAGADSLGLFQQRDTWGPPEVRMDPAGATGLFLDQLTSLGLTQYRSAGVLINASADSRARTMPWLVAQSVQWSAFANGSNYRTHYEEAVAIVSASIDPAEMTGANASYWSTFNADGHSITAARFKPALDTDQIAYCAGTAAVGGADGAAGPWGGWSNGQIPDEALIELVWQPGHRLRPDAAMALTALNAQFAEAFGKNISVTDSYRDLAGQLAARQSWCQRGACSMAATPGTSNHGWGLAVDLGSGINTWGSPERDWMVQNAPTLGWVSPSWAQPGKGKEEPWHWEYQGTASTTPDGDNAL